MEKKYDWKRFLCPRGITPDFQDGGYLTDPIEHKTYQPDIVSFSDIAAIPCIVLLGEAGIGKTRVMASAKESSDNAKKRVLSINLGAYGSEARLSKKIFENESFEFWSEGKGELCLFLDGLDECLLRIDTVTNLLLEELKEYKQHVGRLNLRIACRDFEWRENFEAGLISLFGDKKVGFYTLAPLRRADVIKAVEMEKLDVVRFMNEVDRVQAVPLAIKPVTIELLLRTYERTKELPPNQRVLYSKGCRLLCEETNESRRESNIIAGSFDVEEREVMAKRIAAVTVFAQKYGVWKGADNGNILYEDVSIQALCYGRETANGRKFDINKEAIKETLGTGLFSTCGNRSTWFHQTYAEFLAARYIVWKKLSIPRIMDILTINLGSRREVIPQLHGVMINVKP